MSLMKIKDLFHYEKGSLQSTKATPGEYDFITAAADWKTHHEFTHECEALIFAAAASGSLGRTHYVNGKFISSDLCFIITPKDPDRYPIDIKFYHLLFLAFKDEIVRNTKSGTSKEAIGLRVFGNYELPYFGIDKQVETRKLFVNAQESSDRIESELTRQLDLVKQLRHAFLREAMQGKLVPQDPNDEPASVLLEEIKAEKERLVKEKKIRKPKKLPPIIEEEIPFEISENWVWCRLGDISLYSEGGKSLRGGGVPCDVDGWGVIKTSAITSGHFLELENKVFDNTSNRYQNIIIKKGDLLFCRASGSKGLAGKSCIVRKEPYANLILSDKSIRYVFSQQVLENYIDSYNSSTFASEYYLGLGTKKSTSMNNITRSQFDNLVIPLPSLTEQQRIVTKLDELMKLCEDLEASIKDSQQQNELLLKQILAEALGLEIQKEQSQPQALKTKPKLSKFDPNTTLMEIVALLKMHGKLQAEELWKMSKFYGKAEENRDIDGFYAELKKLIEKEETIKEAEKGYLELA